MSTFITQNAPLLTTTKYPCYFHGLAKLPHNDAKHHSTSTASAAAARQYHLTIFNDENAIRTASDFRALDRSSRRSDVNFNVQFPRKRLKKMTLTDDPRTQTKTTKLMNEFFRCCHDYAKDEVWWQSFLCPTTAISNSTESIQSSQRRQQARSWNQYFTQEKEARLLMEVALEVIDERVTILMEPAAGNGSIAKLFPSSFQSITVDIDVELCTTFGWIHGDFLTLKQCDLGLQKVSSSSVCVITNPPFVKFLAGAERDADLAANFIRQSMMMANTMVCLCPERFRTQHVEVRKTMANVDSWVVGSTMKARFDLGIEHFKQITQPSIIVVFQRC